MLASLTLIGAALATPTIADLPPMERLVPRETVLFWDTPNVTASWERLDATPLGDLLKSDEFRELWREAIEEDGFADELKEAGLDSPEELIPVGRLGIAFFLELDEETGLKQPVYIVAVDYGDRAEKVAKAWLTGGADDAHERGVVTEQRQIRGRTVHVRTFPEPPPVDDADEFNEFDDFDPFGMPDFDPVDLFLGGSRTVCLVQDGEHLIVTSSLLAIDDALGVIDGEPLRSSLAENPEFQEALGQLGSARDSRLILFTAPLQTLLGQAFGGPLAMAQPFVNQLFGDIRAHSLGIEIGDAEAMVTATVGTLAPRGRVGLLTLVDGAAPRGPVPGFVGADAVGYGTMALRLDRLMPLVNQIVQGLPAMVGDMAMPMLEQFGPALEQAFGGLGPDMHVVTYAAPVPGDAEGHSIVAVRCTRIEAVNSLVAMLGPGIGLMPRDFLGQTIYSGGEVGVSIGLGGGWMVIGGDEGVERVLRSVGQADLPTLGDEPAFRQAVGALPAGDMLGWGFSDTIGALEAQRGMVMEMLGGGMAEFDADDAKMKRLLERLTDPAMLKRHIGPTAWTFESRDDGLVFRSRFLRPTAAE